MAILRLVQEHFHGGDTVFRIYPTSDALVAACSHRTKGGV